MTWCLLYLLKVLTLIARGVNGQEQDRNYSASDLCPPGSFSVEYNTNIYCFKLNVHSKNIYWKDAVKSCGRSQTHLATIETKEELEALREKIFKVIIETRNLKHYPSAFNDQSVAFYIGLTRDQDTVAKRFLWQYDDETRPLVINHWLPGQPVGGFSHACGVWFYSNILNYSVPLDLSLGNSSTEKSLFSDYKQNNSEGFISIVCGVKVSQISLCEMRPNGKYFEPVEITRSNDESFNKVQQKTDFTKLGESVVSYIWLKGKVRGFPTFNCEEYDHFIHYSYVCDSVDHCMNRLDERDCDFLICSRCRFSGKCYPSEDKCNFVNDCDDGNDEKSCQSNGGLCCDGTRLPLHLFNDGEKDCNECKTYHDVSFNDETSTPDQLINSTEKCAFICNGNECIYPSQLNDNKTDCTGSDGYLDETLGKLEWANSCSDILGRPIWAPKCVYVIDRYGAVLGCRDLSHLQNCSGFPCQEGYTKCPGSYCIPTHYVSDGKSDCPEGEEEHGPEGCREKFGDCPHHCSGNFKCFSSKVCLHPDLVCDGHPDCPYKDDELNCDVSCPNGLRCIAGTVTVVNSSIANLQKPVFFSARTRYIDLSGTNVSKFNYSFFRQFTNYLVYEYKCSGCAIYEVSEFSILKSVAIIKIDLSYNFLKTLVGFCDSEKLVYLKALNLSFNENLKTFDYCRCYLLENLDLSHTGISLVNENFTSSMVSLSHLNLSHTRVAVFHAENFRTSLKTLDLRGTLIATFSENEFSNLLSPSSILYADFGLCCPQIRGSVILGNECHANEDSFSNCFELIGLKGQRIIFWTMAGAALFGNLIVILFRLIWDRAVLKLAYGLFVLNLGISDLIMGLYLLMIAVADVYYRGVYVFYDKDWRESVACKIAGFLATLSCETSTFFIFLITLERFLVLRFPFDQVRFSKKNKTVAVILAWGTGFILSLFMVTPFFENDAIFTTSAVCAGLPLSHKSVSGWKYSFAIFIVLNFCMFVFIAVGQIGIFRSMSANRMHDQGTRQSAIRRTQDIIVAKQLFLVVLTDFLCWFPVGLLGFLSLSGQEIGHEVYAWTVVLVLPINSAINPLLYTIPVLMAKWEKFKYGKSTSSLRTSL